VWGRKPYEAYRQAAEAVGAEVTAGRPQALEAVERFGRCATRELEELTGTPRPVLEAELWSLARDWKLKATLAAAGTIWELP
jgi:hypothetical protein